MRERIDRSAARYKIVNGIVHSRLRKKGNLFYFWCDPTTWRTSKTTSRLRSTQKVRATQNFINDKMTERVDILWRIFVKNAKKLKMMSQERKNDVLG